MLDPIRIVPLHRADKIAAPAPPQLVYNGGPLLGAVAVVTVFWGAWWQSTNGSALAGELNAFFDFVLTSELLDQLAEYGAGGTTIGYGTRAGSVTIADREPSPTVDDAVLQQLLQDLIAAGTMPPVTPDSLYFVYLPPNVAVVQGSSRSCQAFCGYHDVTSDGIYYAVMPYPGCTGCAGGLPLLDALTSTSSHELCEAITDPVPGTGWYDGTNGEIGDICAWQTRRLGEYVVQLEWSNRQIACT